MNNIVFVIVSSINLLSITIITTLSFVRYEIDKLDGTYNTNMYDYISFKLIALVVVVYIIQTYIIYHKRAKGTKWNEIN